MKEIDATFFTESNHGHDVKTGKALTGPTCLEESTLSHWESNCKPLVKTSTRRLELCSLKVEVERVVTLRYNLQCVGTFIINPTMTHYDNKSLVTNTTVAISVLNKKYLTLVHHFCREHFAENDIYMR